MGGYCCGGDWKLKRQEETQIVKIIQQKTRKEFLRGLESL